MTTSTLPSLCPNCSAVKRGDWVYCPILHMGGVVRGIILPHESGEDHVLASVYCGRATGHVLIPVSDLSGRERCDTIQPAPDPIPEFARLTR
jgi:hypothetical protein